jgi:uncharacterized membrane protein YbhN (UPF0104 family)
MTQTDTQTGNRPRPLKRRLKVLARLAVPVILLALLWSLADGREAADRLGAVDWRWLAVALVFANLQIVLSAWRWQLVLARLGMHLRVSIAIGEYYLAQLVNQTIPGGIVGDAARAVRMRHVGSLSRSAQAVVIERMAGQVALLGVLVVGLVLSLAIPGGIRWPDLALTGLAIGVLVVSALVLIGHGTARIRAVAGFFHQARAALLARGVWWRQGGLSLLIVACNLASFACAALATGTVLSLEASVTLVPLILSAMLIPATIAGWGFREGAAAALFPLIGASASAGLAASVAFGLVILAASLPGLVLLAGRRNANPPSTVAVNAAD